MEERLLGVLNNVTVGAYTKEELLNDNYDDKGMLDSLQIVELVVELENEFEIEINDEDLSIENMKSFETILHMVQRLKSQVVVS